MQRIRQDCTRKIKKLGERGRMRDAIQELANLSNVGVQPDTLAATALVKACCKDMELAQSIFDELFGECARAIELCGWSTNCKQQEKSVFSSGTGDLLWQVQRSAHR